jgi:hypothetical protein
VPPYTNASPYLMGYSAQVAGCPSTQAKQQSLQANEFPYHQTASSAKLTPTWSRTDIAAPTCALTQQEILADSYRCLSRRISRPKHVVHLPQLYQNVSSAGKITPLYPRSQARSRREAVQRFTARGSITHLGSSSTVSKSTIRLGSLALIASSQRMNAS